VSEKKSPVEFPVTFARSASSRAEGQGQRKDQELLFERASYKTVLVDEAWFSSDRTRRFGDDDILIA